MVKTIVAKYGKVDANHKGLRISVIVLLGFAGFFRVKELANIRTSHIEFAHDHMSIFIQDSINVCCKDGH